MDFKNIDYNALGQGYFPAYLGIEIITVSEKSGTARMPIKKEHFAPNTYLHAGSIVTLADSIAGYACLYNLPEKAVSFTTMELKTNFLGTIKEGAILATAVLAHNGKTTQVWDVTVINEENKKTLALFRCTQMILY